MKHYPLFVAGEKATATVELFWSSATVSIKFPHRRGQRVLVDLAEAGKVSAIAIDRYNNYTAVRFVINPHDFVGPLAAAEHCGSLIKGVHKHINFDASDALITKEILNILG